MRKPASVVHSVTHELSMIGLRYCHSAPNTSEGAGRMVSGTSRALHTISHSTKSASVNAAGDTTLIANSARYTHFYLQENEARGRCPGTPAYRSRRARADAAASLRAA